MLTSYLRVGHAPSDTDRERKLKSVFALVMVGVFLLGLQFIFFRERSTLEFIIDIWVLVAVVGSLLLLQAKKRHDLAFVLFMSLVIPAELVFLLLGGNREGDLIGFAIIPIWAIVMLGAHRSILWFIVSLLAVFFVIAVDPFLPHISSSLHKTATNPDGWLFHASNKKVIGFGEATTFTVVVALIYMMVYSAYRALHQANEQIEDLLLNVLPPSIAVRLTQRGEHRHPVGGATIADEFEQATILFADLVGFTELTATLSAPELVKILDRVFTEFDTLATEHSVEKIKTIGDAYMAVCGLPEPNSDQAANIADMALEMIGTVRRLREELGIPLSLKIGINTGPVIAGIIGRKKFSYDLWGDAVNIASRMESQSKPETIQVGEGTYEALADRYEFQSLGAIHVKGKKSLPTWRLVGKRDFELP